MESAGLCSTIFAKFKFWNTYMYEMSTKFEISCKRFYWCNLRNVEDLRKRKMWFIEYFPCICLETVHCSLWESRWKDYCLGNKKDNSWHRPSNLTNEMFYLVLLTCMLSKNISDLKLPQIIEHQMSHFSVKNTVSIAVLSLPPQ